YYDASILELRKYVQNLKDEQNKEILKDLLPAIKEIVEAEDSTEVSTEDSPYDLIALNLPNPKDSTKDSN
ncbi:11318_t:CDS:1, partial [Racocetra persica]